MKTLLACCVFAVVCMASSSVFAQEVPATPTEESAASTPIVVEKGGILVQNKSPILVDITMPDQQPAPVVNNSIDFPDVMKTRDVGKSACGRSPGWCAFGVGVGVVAVIALGAYAADQAGMFDTTNTMSFK